MLAITCELFMPFAAIGWFVFRKQWSPRKDE